MDRLGSKSRIRRRCALYSKIFVLFILFSHNCHNCVLLGGIQRAGKIGSTRRKGGTAKKGILKPPEKMRPQNSFILIQRFREEQQKIKQQRLTPLYFATMATKILILQTRYWYRWDCSPNNRTFQRNQSDTTKETKYVDCFFLVFLCYHAIANLGTREHGKTVTRTEDFVVDPETEVWKCAITVHHK